MMPIQTTYPPGTIGVASASLARYHEFSISLESTLVPPGTQLQWRSGLNLARHWNECVRDLNGEWLWCLNDDHTWEPELLMRLLDHEVDVVAVPYPNRHAPFPPTVIHKSNGAFIPYNWDEVDEQTGLVELPLGDTVGHAGMLIRKSVFEQIPDPWFEVGQIETDVSMLDAWWCQKLAARNISIYVDFSIFMDHLLTVRLRVARNEAGKLRPHYQALSKMDVPCLKPL